MPLGASLDISPSLLSLLPSCQVVNSKLTRNEHGEVAPNERTDSSGRTGNREETAKKGQGIIPTVRESHCVVMHTVGMIVIGLVYMSSVYLSCSSTYLFTLCLI